MIREDSLHQLIRSLDSSEKRLFKMSVSNSSKEKQNHYIELFDVLSKLETYDELKLKKKIKNPSTIKNLAQSKKYLKDLIMKSMIEIDSNTPENDVSELLKQALFLSKKNLFKEKWKKLVKSKQIADKYELFNHTLDILDKQMKHLIEFDFDKSVDYLNDYKKEKKEILDKIKTREDLIISRNIVFQILRKYRKKLNSEIKIQLDNEIQLFKEDKISQQNTFVNSFHFSVLLANYYEMIGDSILTNQNRKKALDLLKKYPHFKYKYNYLGVYFNYIGSLFRTGDFPKLKEELNFIETHELNTKNNEGEFFQSFALYSLLYLLNTGDFKEAYDLESRVEDGILKYRKKINDSSLTTICYNYSSIYFFNLDFERTHKWINEIQKINSKVRTDIVSFSKVLNIICHYELKNYLLIEPLIRSFRRSENANEFEKLVIKNIFALSHSIDSKKSDIFKKMKVEILKLKEQNNRILGYSIIEIWINSFLANKTINELYRESLISS